MAKKYGTAPTAGYTSDDTSANNSKHDKNNPRRRVVIGPQNNMSDTVSELSQDDTASVSSGFSKSSAAFRARFAPSRFGKKNKKEKEKNKKKKKNENGDEDDHGSEGGGSSKAGGGNGAAPASAAASATANRVRFEAPQDAPSNANSNSNVKANSNASSPSSPQKSRNKHHPSDVERLRKDAKSRYNIGLIYLKTGDYHKAQENLEHSLYCHIQLAGHESSLYDNQSILRIASVREKLGDCYYANTAVVDKCLALDHYEEAKRLLKGVHEEDAEEELLEMLERVEEKLGQEGLCRGDDLRRVPSAHPLPGSRYDAKERGVARGVGGGVGVVGVGAATAAGAAAGGAAPRAPVGAASAVTPAANATVAAESAPAALAGFGHLGKVTHKIHKGIGKFTNDLIDTVDAAFDGVIDGDLFHARPNNIASAVRSSLKGSENSEVNAFGLAMVHLERENHRTALNQLDEVHSSATLMADPNVRVQMVEYLMRIGDASYEAQKFAVVTDAYEKIFSIYYEEQKDIDVDGGRTLQLAIKGCIRCHKKLALEDERKEEYLKAIHHRNRIYQLLDTSKRTIPACQQLVMIAFLHGQLEQYKESADALSDAIRRLFQGVQSFDLMPKDRISLLIRCYHMRAICYAKQKLWNKAFEQYDEALPLIAREEGMNSRDYNSALIHKSALLVTTGDYATALATVNQYFKNARDSLTVRQGQRMVDDGDHIIALDTLAAAHLKLGNVDNAIETFEKKLAFVEYVPKNDELKSETMHKLGCLLAYKKRHEEALPLLTGALDKRKYLYDSKSKFLFESSWAVAATSHSLGNSATALKEYGSLLEKINKIDDLPVDSVVIHNSAGKLFFDDGKIDKAIKAFKEALKLSESSTKLSPSIKADIRLNLANALSAKGDIVASLKMYDEVLAMDSIQGTKEYYLTLYNQSLTVLKDGDLEETKLLLGDIVTSRSKSAKGVKGNAYITLGNISLTEGNTDDALQFFESALKIFSDDPEELASATQAKKSMAMTFSSLGLFDDAISTLEDALEKLSRPGAEGKKFHLLKADLWSSMSRVHQQRGDVAAAKNFSKLALQNYKDSVMGYGENHPITLRNTSNLAVILLQEAESLPKDKSKPIIDAAKFEMEDALQKFIALNDMWTYRLDVASLKTNLGFVAVWQGKPKKARKLLRQIQEIEIPESHPLVGRIGILEQRVVKLEKAKSK